MLSGIILKNNRPAIAVFLSVLFLSASFPRAEEALPPALAEVGITEKIGTVLPMDLQFTNSDGNTVALRDYFTGEKPVILSFVYFNCPMLCNLVVTGVKDAVNNLPGLGSDYKVLTISFDPKDTVDRAKASREHYFAQLNTRPEPDDWHFLVGAESSIKALTDAAGFYYQYNETTQEYAHGSAIFIITPEGKISRYLYGIEYPAKDLKLSLLEAKKENTISTIERALLFCYNYDPQARSYVLHAVNIMKLGGLLTVIAVAFLLIILKLQDVRNRAGQ